jgi:RimJ/RimL family protein N-acetyltransferase
MPDEIALRIEPWAAGDLPLLQELNAPEMWRHLGGPESPEKVLQRQRRFECLQPDEGRMFRIVADATGEDLGSVGFWRKDWRGGQVYEVGWMVLPAHQGRGIARRATALAIDRAWADGRQRLLHAFPSVENAASNAICRKLGFTLLEACDFEFPPGSLMRCNDWRLDLEDWAADAGQGRRSATSPTPTPGS